MVAITDSLSLLNQVTIWQNIFTWEFLFLLIFHAGKYYRVGYKSLQNTLALKMYTEVSQPCNFKDWICNSPN